MRWSLLLQQYMLSVIHCPGKENIVADFFSRNFNPETYLSPHDIAIFRLQMAISEEMGPKAIKPIKQLFAEKPLRSEMADIAQVQKNDVIIN